MKKIKTTPKVNKYDLDKLTLEEKIEMRDLLEKAKVKNSALPNFIKATYDEGAIIAYAFADSLANVVPANKKLFHLNPIGWFPY